MRTRLVFPLLALLGACETRVAVREEPGRDEIDAAVLAALDYVVDLEQRTTVHQGDRAFRVNEGVTVLFNDRRRTPRWSSAVADSVRARGWTVVPTLEDARICGDGSNYWGEPECRLRREPDGLLLWVASVRFTPSPLADYPPPEGTGGILVALASHRNRVVPFDEDLYEAVDAVLPFDENLYDTIPGLLPGVLPPIYLGRSDDVKAEYDRRAGASGGPGVLDRLDYSVRVVPGGLVTHSAFAPLRFHGRGYEGVPSSEENPSPVGDDTTRGTR